MHSLRPLPAPRLPALILMGALLAAAPPAAAQDLRTDWPSSSEVADQGGLDVRIPSRSPFTLKALRAGEGDPTEAVGTLFLPDGASADDPVPAVVLLHGTGGVRSSREPVYARQLAAMGVAALVLDVFRARPDFGSSFVERVLNITESMYLADAYAGLAWLADRPEIDPERIALVGFSYGGMASLYAANARVAEAALPDGPRFAGHAAFYAPCIARFARPATTGAPVLMLMGDEDDTVDVERCAETAAELEAGGSDVERIVYPGAAHQWDGRSSGFEAPRAIGGCDVLVTPDLTIRDQVTGLTMSGRWSRLFILQACSDGDGYLIRGDPAVRAQSNAALARFLGRVFEPRA